MARHVFFSFNYSKDVWRVNQIRSMPNIIGSAAAGFHDNSLWEKAKRQGEVEIKRLINNGLKGTSVTVVCITAGTANRYYINYEIDKSLERGNGLLGVQIHGLKDSNGNTTGVGASPRKIEANGFKVYKYVDKDKLAHRIEEAAKLAGK